MQLDLPRRKLTLSLTPLIDVVFILLVFFMLASNFLQWRGLALSVPGVGQARVEAEPPLWLSLHEDGSLLVDGEAVALESLPQRLRGRLVVDPERSVSLQPVGEVPLQRVISVLDALNAAGVHDVTLVEE